MIIATDNLNYEVILAKNVMKSDKKRNKQFNINFIIYS